MKFGRRTFFGIGVSAALVNRGFGAENPFPREDGTRWSLALAAYSFRNHFGFIKGKPNRKVAGGEALDMKQFIRYCAARGVGAELTSYFFPPDADDSYFLECRKEAHLNGVPIAGTAVGNQFTHVPGSEEAKAQMTYVKEWIDRAVLMGAPHVRVFAGRIPRGMPEEQAEKHAIEALAEAGEYAASRGVFLGIENHDSIGSAERLLHIVTSVKNPWVGVNLDSGNFRTEDPYHDFAESVPFAVNVQLKTHLRVGDEKKPVEMKKIFDRLREGRYSGFVVLEYEETDPYENVPGILEELRGYCDR